MLALDDLLEGTNGLLQGHILALIAGELFGNMEGLAEETLYLTGTVNGQLVFVAQFIHTHDGDDVLQLLVALQNALHSTGGFIVLLTHDFRGQDPGGRVQRIHGRVDTQAGDAAVQNRGGIQVGEGGSGGRVCQVVSRHVNGLDGGDGTILGGGDTLLQGTHFRSQGGLVTNGGGHTAQQSGNLGTGLGETEDVVDKQKHILMLHIPEVFCHCQAGKANTHTGSGGLVHLTKDHGGFADNTGFGHFVVQVIAFAGTLTNAGEDRIAVVGGGNVVNELLNQNGFADAGTAEQTDLTALCVGADQVNNLDTGFQDLGSGLLFLIRGGRAVDGPTLLSLHIRLIVDGLTQQIEYAAQAFIANRNGNGSTGVGYFRTALQAVRGGHGNTADHIVTDMLGDLRDNGLVPVGNFDSVQQTGQLILFEANIQNRTHDLDHCSFVFGHGIQLLVWKVC